MLTCKHDARVVHSESAVNRNRKEEKEKMQKVNLNNIEKLDFRSRESYKTLRTNLEFAGKKRKVIAVTSCTPNEGKTSVSFQLPCPWRKAESA